MIQIRYFLGSGPDSVLFGPFFRGRSEPVQGSAPSTASALRTIQRGSATVQNRFRFRDSPLGMRDHQKVRPKMARGEDGGGGAGEHSAPPHTVSSTL